MIFSDEMHELLDILHSKNELDNDTPSGISRVLTKFGKALVIFSTACYPILGISTLFILSSKHPSFLMVELAMIVALIQIFSAALWTITDLISLIIDLAQLKSRTFLRRKQELKHDLKSALDLCIYDIETLQTVDKWLSLKIERMKIRLGMFFGGGDKVAVLALAGTGWSVWHNLPDGVWSWEKRIYFYGMGMVAGLAIGGMLMNWLIKKLSYQRDLLTLAIQYKNSNSPLR